MNPSVRRTRTALCAVAVALCLPFSAGAADKKAQPKKKADVVVPKIDLSGIGSALPDAKGLEARKADGEELRTRSGEPGVSYQVVAVEHAYDFTRTAQGVKPVGEALQAISLYGKPPSTPKFTTRVKVKASQPVSTSIELVILDPRGDTAMSGSGELSFRGNKTGEVDYLLDWSPTPQPKGGEYKLLVRIAGQPMGTWPLKVVEEAR